MAKRIRVSSDDVTFYTLPGSSGELSNEAGELKDTIFGQTFESGFTGMVASTLSSNAIYKGFTGYQAIIKKASGSSTTMTGEAMSLVSGKTFKVTASSKNYWDHTATWTVYDGVTDVTAHVASFDFLFGQITFEASYTVVGSITVTGKYFTAAQIAKGRSFKLTQTADAIQESDFVSAQANSGIHTYSPGLRKVALELGGLYNVSNGWQAAILARSELIIEIAPVGSATTESVARGIFVPKTRKQSGDVGALEEETINFILYVPDEDLMLTPFRWEHPATTHLNTAIQKCLDAWEDETMPYVQYLPDGTTGYKWDAVVTEVSLSGGLEALNTFSVNFQLSDAATAVS